ncbi:alpha-1,6-mannosyl-glycoprotein 2-beta-N-acetylglucosaminyltransferase-like [Haliotis cracherodii]|uniref:alpha-1,6-mannosyl-glycoprotein 2-beta-N-acetylglucosaminyltransferase-like n=1 Tax=Haliotis rufescens TaxID=6454 RepID=UPI001EB0A3FE|nr:alpha-1,6-mannosyl-glycoprotein 2-beta-N-acetylglucosaminyltransferase-like [Haliotis rufescens]XP_046358532.1 alpha-1,6-mannosyl-glycoprotein 2-beta-N-acetylglucosaminyltransferase-like [Haliotis rufescens]XP_046358534.1 alpha-1,6-mannosyl-glycoprotein 2-beta-N-acetylglucosaminyltransferase-like [Haliotis rufescens]
MRIYPRRVFRSILMVAMLLFVMLNLHILMTSQPDGIGEYDHQIILQGHHRSLGEMHVQFGEPVGYPYSNLPQSTRAKLVIPPKSGDYNNATISINRNIDTANISLIKAEIAKINKAQKIHNLDRFGLKLDAESVVIVVQVHDRHDYLRILLDSLKKVRNIHKTLLIISHDVYAEELNELVESIDFVPVMQIFFPFSQQIYQTGFPSEHPNDCPRDIKKDQALKRNCNNAAHPDKYGHYREAKYCQAKHHWMWKLHHVFEDLDVMKDYEGMVLLLEDDYYVTEDVLTILQMMQNLAHKDCKDCRMLVIGNYDKVQNYQANSGKVERAYWISSKHNMGMVFTRVLWNEIKKCFREFCLHDDYNWDWTIQHLSMKCIPNKIRTIKMKASRIFHIGECGMHMKGKSCNPGGKLKKVEELIAKNKQFLFPNVLSVAGDSRFKLRDPKANGGWGDQRDHEMCLSFLYRNTTLR